MNESVLNRDILSYLTNDRREKISDICESGEKVLKQLSLAAEGLGGIEDNYSFSTCATSAVEAELTNLARNIVYRLNSIFVSDYKFEDISLSQYADLKHYVFDRECKHISLDGYYIKIFNQMGLKTFHEAVQNNFCELFSKRIWVKESNQLSIKTRVINIKSYFNFNKFGIQNPLYIERKIKKGFEELKNFIDIANNSDMPMPYTFDIAKNIVDDDFPSPVKSLKVYRNGNLKIEFTTEDIAINTYNKINELR